LITGASAGIGRASVLELATRFSHITIIGRDPARHDDLLSRLRAQGARASLVESDLTSLGEVAEAAARVRDDPVGATIDVIIANAGVAGARGRTRDGFELAFGVNHVAHHLLITELADRITDRVVVVASNAHYESAGVDLDRVQERTPSFTGFSEYRDSKLANVLFGRELARRFGFATHIVHPGLVATRIWRRIPWPIRPLVTRRMATPAEGARNVIWAATEDGLESGAYYAACARHQPSTAALDNEAARRLWEQTEEWLVPFRRSSS
jgi:retinol dehydrogenase 12